MIRAVAHIHSTHSFDGKVPLPAIAAEARRRGIDAVLLAEHVETIGASKYAEIVDECRALSGDGLLVVPGLELEDLNLLVYGLGPVAPWASLDDLVGQARDQGAFIALSHPAKLHAGALDHVEEVIEGVEVWNRKYDGRSAPRPLSMSLHRGLRETRPSLVAISGLDLHRASDWADIHMALGAERNDRDAIVGALRAGRVRIVAHGAEIPIAADDPPAARALYRIRSAACVGAFDAVHLAHRGLRRSRLPVPAGMKRLVKRLF